MHSIYNHKIRWQKCPHLKKSEEEHSTKDMKTKSLLGAHFISHKTHNVLDPQKNAWLNGVYIHIHQYEYICIKSKLLCMYMCSTQSNKSQCSLLERWGNNNNKKVCVCVWGIAESNANWDRSNKRGKVADEWPREWQSHAETGEKKKNTKKTVQHLSLLTLPTKSLV